MSFLQSLAHIPKEWLVALGAVVAGLLLLWVFSLYSRRRFITITKSEETELIAFQLRRIADAVERLSTMQQQAHPQAEPETSRHIATSIFGR